MVKERIVSQIDSDYMYRCIYLHTDCDAAVHTIIDVLYMSVKYKLNITFDVFTFLNRTFLRLLHLGGRALVYNDYTSLPEAYFDGEMDIAEAVEETLTRLMELISDKTWQPVLMWNYAEHIETYRELLCVTKKRETAHRPARENVLHATEDHILLEHASLENRSTVEFFDVDAIFGAVYLDYASFLFKND
ncbi:hypothetical protein THOM_2782, partial [Trachipleistophora hominis]